MEPTILNYKGYFIELFQHPIYHDFEFVIKRQDGSVVTASVQQYQFFEDAEVNAKMVINEL